jgi:hypothetical protein
VSEAEVASGCFAIAVCLAFFAQPPAKDAPRSKSKQILRLVDMPRSLGRSVQLGQRPVPLGCIGTPSTDARSHVVYKPE